MEVPKHGEGRVLSFFSRELGLSQPLTRLGSGEGHTRWRERGLGESQFRRRDTHVLCVPTVSFSVIFASKNATLHRKKGYRFSRPQPGCQIPNSPWPGIIKLFPPRENLVSDVLLGTAKIGNLFLQCRVYHDADRNFLIMEVIS